MASDIEDGVDQQQCDQGAPLSHPTRGWLRRKISKIARLQQIKLSQTGTKKAMAELQRAILTGTDNIECQRTHRSLSTTFVTAMSTKAQSTVAKIRRNVFYPCKLPGP